MASDVGSRAVIVRRVLVMALAGVVAACGEAGPAPERGGTVVIGAGSDLDHANPLVSADGWTNEILRYALFTPLVRYGPGLEYEPYLAESWDMLGDTAVVFHLRRDIRWHDGRPTTAHDVLFTIERAMDPATGFTNSDYFARWKHGEVLDSFTVRFSLEPHAEPLAGLPFTPVVPRHVLDTVPPEALRQTGFNRRPVGNGPFRFVSQRANDRWVFEANPDFTEGLGGPPLIDRLVWRVIPSNAAQIAEIRAGETHLVLQPRPEQVLEVAELDGIRAVVKPSRQFSFVAWNGLRPPLDDARVRRALAMAIDRQELVDALRRGFAEVAVGPIMPFHWSFDPDLEPLPYAPDSARALLAEAGVRDRDGNGSLELPDGSAFRLEIKMLAESDYNRDLAEAVRNDLAELGVQATTRALEATTLFSQVMSPERPFDAALLAWSGDFRLDLRDLFHSREIGEPYQFASYRNPELDSLLDRAIVQLDRDRAIPLWRNVQQLLRDEQPWTPLYYQTDAFLARDRLKGFETDIRGTFRTLPDWWLEGEPRDASEEAAQAGGEDGE